MTQRLTVTNDYTPVALSATFAGPVFEDKLYYVVLGTSGGSRILGEILGQNFFPAWTITVSLPSTSASSMGVMGRSAPACPSGKGLVVGN